MHLCARVLLCSVVISASVLALADSPVVATVGSKNITLDEFNRRYDEVKKRAVNPPPKKLFLEDLIRYEMGVQEAEKRELDKDPVVAERMREELYKSLVEKDLADKVAAIQVNENEMKDYYKENPELHTQHILIEVKQSATPEERAIAKKRAEEIYQDVKKSKKPFEDLVKLYSDDIATKSHGGDVGWQTRMTVYPTYYEAAMKLKSGQISNIVETPHGFHIIKMKGEHPYAEANKRMIREGVFEKKRLALFNDYFDKIRKHYKVTVNSDAIK
jgi:parvulin-like peptidyl-prolyl isomerase